MKSRSLVPGTLLLALCLVSIPASAGDITGDWMGTLKAGAVELRIAIHISEEADGSLKAALDSIDQNVMGIPVSSVSIRDSKVALAAETLQASYEGVIGASGNTIDGTWTQGSRSTPLVLKRRDAAAVQKPAPAEPSDIGGVWMGTLDAGPIKLRIVFHISNTAEGLAATMDSPDQNAEGLPVTKVTRSGSSLTMEMKQMAAAFSGTLNPDLEEIKGTFKQAGASFPLILKRVKDTAELERRRPQTPEKPYPYSEEEVQYENGPAGIKLAGTLTVPEGPGPFPAAVLISGSGAQDRNESIMGHKPFLVLADHLTRRGIAVLRTDDRGSGKSGGNFASATSADFATDVEAGVAFLKTRPEVDARKIGLIGHSEGGLIAPMVAAENRDIAYIVMMAGTGVPGYKVLEEQVRLVLESTGVHGAGLEEAVALQRESIAIIREEKDTAKLRKALNDKMSGKIPRETLENQIRMIGTAWFRYFLEYDPATDLRNVRCPVLAINGEKDTQVSPAQNLPAIRSALQAGGNNNFKTVELTGLNHLFQRARTGSPAEYGDIEETISPVALNTISDWIHSVFTAE